MKWTAEADLVVGLACVSGKKKLGVGLGIGRRKVIKNIGLDLGDHLLRRFGVFFVKNSSVSSVNWSLERRNNVYLDRQKAMKRSNVFNLLLQMMPSSQQAVAPSSPDHWAFLEEVNAPQWVDLVKEASLMGTLGDDPWFRRCHMHHETSLARAPNLETVVDPHRSSIGTLDRPQQQPTRKGAHSAGKLGSSKLIKPSLKGNVVKACLGMHRISGGSTGGNRLSSRVRRSSSLSRSIKPIKTVNIIHRSGGGRLLQQQQQKKGAGSDTRVAQNEPSSTVGIPKKPLEGKTGKGRRDEAVLNRGRAAALNNKSGGSASEIDDTSLTDLSSSSIALYPLPSPLNQGSVDLSADTFRLRSSPNDITLSNCASPVHSLSSQESSARGLISSAAEAALRKILKEGKSALKGRRSNVKSSEALEIRSQLPLTGEITEVITDEPLLEISGAVANSPARTIGATDWSQQGPKPGANRSSLGPPMRVKQVEKMGSSNAKKKTSKVVDSNNSTHHTTAPTEKSVQATHPILEKLRKSWGSALRVKQRQEAEAAVSDTASESSAEHSDEGKTGNVASFQKQWDQVRKVPSEIMRSAPSGAATTLPPTEREVLIRNIITRERRAVINQHQQPQQLQLTMDANEAPPSPSRAESGAHIPADRTTRATAESKSGTGLNAAKVGLAKIQANYQRSKSDTQSKFKKQYVHETNGVNKSLSIQRGNKENLQFDMKVKGQVSPPSGVGWKKKPAVPRRQLSPRQVGTGVNGVRSVPPTPARTFGHTFPSPRPAYQTSSHRKGSVDLTKSDTFITLSSRTGGHDAAETSGVKSQLLYTALNNSGISRGGASSSLKFAKQRSEKIPRESAKDAVANAAVVRASKTSVHTANEAVPLAAEDRKLKTLAPQYEPRLHSLKTIKEWESKSGKRYYDLPPVERRKVNQDITAASKTVVTKRTST